MKGGAGPAVAGADVPQYIRRHELSLSSRPIRGLVSSVSRLSDRVGRAVHRRALSLLYARGRRRESAVEPAEPSILRLGERLRTASLDENRGRFSGTPWRFLLCTPPSVAAEVWFTDLAEGMRHAGVPVRSLPAFTRVDAALLDEFRPNVVVALDQEPALAYVDLFALREHKRTHGCLRLFVSTREIGRAHV